MALASLLNIILSLPTPPETTSGCSFHQEVEVGASVVITNPQFPYVSAGPIGCTWNAQSPPDSTFFVNCEEFDIPNIKNCKSANVSISPTGDPYLRDAKVYCGKGNLTLTTKSNKFFMGFFASEDSAGGLFVCNLTALPSEASSSPCNCGQRNERNVSIGKKLLDQLLPNSVSEDTADVNEYPFMAAIIDIRNRSSVCGATIISPKYSLSAAHCFDEGLQHLEFIVGTERLIPDETGLLADSYNILRFQQHPSYKIETKQDNIAILLTETIYFNRNVGPICLPFQFCEHDFSLQHVEALTWSVSAGYRRPVQHKTDLLTISNYPCSTILQNSILPQQICTLRLGENRCHNYEGGPLIWKDSRSGKFHLLGIISDRLGCTNKKVTVHTRVAPYLDWIVANTPQTNNCTK